MAFDYGTLDWGYAGAPGGGLGGFGGPSPAQVARGLISEDDYRTYVNKFGATPGNEQFLRSLGFQGNAFEAQDIPGTDTGSGLTSQGWSPEALNFLHQGGYNLGVGHAPGTAAQGRAEYWGLIDKDGKYVQGQDVPTSSMSDTWSDMATPFMMMAGPLGMQLGLGAVGTGAAVGGVSGAASAKDAGENLLTGALKGALKGGATAWAGGQLMDAFDGVSLADIGDGSIFDKVGQNVSDSLGTLYDKGVGLLGGGGVAPIPTASLDAVNVVGSAVPSAAASLGGAAGLLPALTGAVSSGIPDARVGVTGQSQAQPIDYSSLLGGAGGFTGQSPEQLERIEVQGVKAEEPASAPFDWQSLVSDGLASNQQTMEDWLEDNAIKAEPDYSASTIGSSFWNAQPDWWSAIKNGIGGAASLVGGGKNLAALFGAGLGASQGGGTRTTTNEPWAPAQPYLLNVLGDADNMLSSFRQNPLTAQQNNQFAQGFAGLDQARAAVPGLLNWGQSAMQRQSTTPSYAQLFGGGLLGQAQPTAQAGGAGGLLGNSQEDRLKALMAGGRGLIG